MAAVADTVQNGQTGDAAATSIVALTNTASGPPPQSNTFCSTPLSTVHHTGTTHQPVYNVTGVKRESQLSTNEAVQSKLCENTTPQQSQVLVTGTSSESQSVVLATPDGRILKIPQHLMTASTTTRGVPMNSIALIDASGTKLLVAPTPVTSSQYSSMSTRCVEAPQASASVPTSTAERPEVATPDSNSPKQAYMLCKVCGDKASGYHYGVTSCEGCKGFFRRSIQKRIEYRCLRDGNCVVIRLNRNRCQHCRFKKCLTVGMSRDSVRYGRMGRKGSSSSINESTSNSENEQLAIYDIILNISQAHHSNCAYTEDRLKSLHKISASLLPVGREDESPESQRLVMWQDLASRITATIQRVVEFAKRVPGFAQIAQDDQLILIKAGFFELWLLRLSRTINSKNQVVMFEDGGCIPLHQLKIVLTPELVKSMVDFTDGLAALALNDTEIGLISGIVLSTSDRPNLLNPPEVEKIQNRLIGALKLQLSRNHGDEQNLFSTILMRLPELRAIGLAHSDQLQRYRQHWEILTVPPLFSEIYDIPKNEVVEASV